MKLLHRISLHDNPLLCTQKEKIDKFTSNWTRMAASCLHFGHNVNIEYHVITGSDNGPQKWKTLTYHYKQGKAYLLIEGPLKRSFFLSIYEVILCIKLKIIGGQTHRLETSIFKFTKYFTRNLIDQNIFFPELSFTVSQYFITLALIAVWARSK